MIINIEQKTHSEYGPSSAKQWIHCPGSIKMSREIKGKFDTDYSREGTAAHAVAEDVLKKYLETRELPAKKGYLKSRVCMDGFFDYVPVTEEMLDAVYEYVDYIAAKVSPDDIHMSRKDLKVESKISLAGIGIPECTGTADTYIYDRVERVLEVIDYKHGAGVPVSPVWNDQGLCYGLGAFLEVYHNRANKMVMPEHMVQTVRITIVQPRTAYTDDDIVKSWDISVEDILGWAHMILKPAVKATKEENPVLRPGECQFCKVGNAGKCPALANKAIEVTRANFEKKTFPETRTLTDEQVAECLNFVKFNMSDWVKGLEQHAYNLLNMGAYVPGWKLVLSKHNRKWIDAGKADTELKKLIGDERYKTTLVTPAQAETLISKTGYGKSVIAGLWETPEGSPVLAPESDKREAITPVNAFPETQDTKDEFDALFAS